MRKRSGQVHSRESSATLQLTVSLLYPLLGRILSIFNLYDMIITLSTLSSRKEVYTLIYEYILAFFISVLAGIVSYYICKWLDRDV